MIESRTMWDASRGFGDGQRRKRRFRLLHESALGAMIAAVLLGVACGGEARFQARYSPGLALRPLTVSVLGVSRAGMLSEVASATLASEMSRVLHPRSCPAGYGPTLQTQNVEIWSAMRALVERHGIGVELFEAVAPAAGADHLLAVEMYGREAVSTAQAELRDRAFLGQTPGLTRARPPPSNGPPRAPDWEISASLFSSSSGEIEVSSRLEYMDSDADGALRRFADELGSTFPALSCAGWNWSRFRVAYRRDAAGLPLRNFDLVPAASD